MHETWTLAYPVEVVCGISLRDSAHHREQRVEACVKVAVSTI